MLHLTPGELKAYLEQADSQPLLLDVREPWEFDLCRLEGSVNLPISRIVQALDQLDPGRETVVICHHGARSFQVANFLEQRGFHRVINLAGGIDAWSREVDPGVPRY